MRDTGLFALAAGLVLTVIALRFACALLPPQRSRDEVWWEDSQ